MIRILHIVGVMNRAGLETFIMNMYRNLNRKQFSFDFLCLIKQKGAYDDEIIDLGGEIHYAQIKQYGGIMRHVYNYKFLKNSLEKYRDTYDVIHIHNYHAFDSYIIAKAAVDAKCKNVIVHSHSTSAEFHKGLHYLFRPFLNGLNIERLACSQNAGKWLFGKDNIKVISNGIDAKKYKYNPQVRDICREELGLKNCYVIGHVGRFEHVKNQLFLCKILPNIQKKISNVKLVFVGEGAERNDIESFCKENRLNNVMFLGARSDVDRLYQAFDLFAFPSFFEGIPLSIIEAETSGLPCIVSTGVPNGIDFAKNVYHIELDKPEIWVDIISNFYKKDIDRSQNYNLVLMNGYDINNSCRALEQFYTDVIEGDRR